MNITVLKNLGLSEKSAQIYLTTLSLGTTTVQAIAHKANLKRPTVYLHIEELLRDGFIEKIPLGKKDYFRATDPKILEQRAQHTLSSIQAALPDLQALQSVAGGKPSVRVLEGEAGMTQVYQEIAQANSICFWSNLSSFEQQFPEMFTKLSSAIATNQIRTREIIADTAEARKSSKRYAQLAGKQYSSRVALGGEIQNDNAVYGDVVALFRIYDFNLFVIRIEDKTIANTMKTMFNLAWTSAEPFIGRK